MPDGQETRIVDATTGGAKGSKLAAFHLIPWTIVREVAEHFGRGARKYEDRNWERGYAWSLSFAALHRHLEAFWNRDEIDNDPSLYVDGEAHNARHIIAVVWHALVLAWFSRYSMGTDDRPWIGTTDTGTPELLSERMLLADRDSVLTLPGPWRAFLSEDGYDRLRALGIKVKEGE